MKYKEMTRRDFLKMMAVFAGAVLTFRFKEFLSLFARKRGINGLKEARYYTRSKDLVG